MGSLPIFNEHRPSSGVLLFSFGKKYLLSFLSFETCFTHHSEEALTCYSRDIIWMALKISLKYQNLLYITKKP